MSSLTGKIGRGDADESYIHSERAAVLKVRTVLTSMTTFLHTLNKSGEFSP